MSNLPPNPYNTSGPPAMEADASQLNHNPSHNFVPPGQLPPGYGSLKQDANSNSPIPSSMLPPNSAIGQLNNYNQSANSSPAFNHSGMMPLTGQSSPMRPNMKPSMSQSSNQNFMNPSASVSNASPISFTSNYQQRQINDNAPPLIPSSHSQPVLNGPPTLPPVASQPSSEYFTAINSFDTNASKTDGSPNIVPGSFAHQVTSPSSIMSKPISGVLSPQSAPLSRNSPLVGSITGQPNSSATSMGSTQSRPGINGASNMSGPSGFQHAPVGLKGPGGPPGHVGQPFSPPTGSPSSGSSVTLQPAGPPSGPASAASSALMSGSKGSIVSGSPSRPITSGPMMAGPNVQAMSGPPSASSMTSPPMSGSIGPTVSGPSSGPSMASPSSFHSFSGPAVSGPPIGGPPKPSMGAPPSLHSMSTPTGSVVSGPSIGGPPSGPTMAAPPSLHSMSGPPIGPAVSGPPIGPAVSGPPIGPAVSGPPIGPAVSGPPIGPAVSGPPYGGPPKPLMGTPPSLHSVSGPPIGAPPIGPSMVSPPGSYAMSPPLGGPASGPTMASPSYSSMSGPPMGPPVSGPPMGPPVSGPPMGPPVSGPPMGPPVSGPPMGPLVGGPPMGLPVSGPPTGPMAAPNLHSMSGPPMGPPVSGPPSGPSGPMGPPGAYGQKNGLPGSSAGPYGPGLQSPQGYQGGMPPKPTQGPPPYAGPTNPPSNMQGRYPPIPQGNYISQQPQMSQPQFPSYQGLNQQMGQLSVTKQGFDQLWGHHMVDLMTTKNILPEYPEDPPEIRLANQFADAPNCSPEIFRCTVNRIPETNSLLQKSRLPLGILIHPFKDLNHLPVIQCTTIVRCRACRTYINPFVYFVDAKRWKCNLCYRVNDLPEEFQYDPVSKSYGDPSRRPEIKSATIEFIAPGEYMLRPPQPAVYLFLMDVSQIARDSGYLQVLCETLKTQLDQLPGDARTQVGFICFDAHVHCYLMSDGLTRVKEMTVLDIDDVFLPSPESLLVNLGERREMVRELLTALPQRFAAPGPPSSALGAALQLAYKLMAPTGGRVTVFQTCLPNVGPGALQSREDPNARSAAEVAHLSPATDFYKRLALDCSGAQIAVDLFLLNAQYADLATLSGMSKFSAGTVYHLPLFRAQRQWQADLFARMLTRYLTRKIGFEAVMRVRCTRGISIHTFHGNFFVRSTDLLSLPNVSPDAGFGMQLAIEESLADLQQVCFQAALLYTSSKGERRIRVHTLALPTASNLTDVLHSADQQCIIGLLSKMAVDRCVSASMGEAREALSNVCVDLASASRLAQNLPSGAAASIVVPYAARLLPLYLLALLKRKAFRAGTSTRLDDRVSDMCDMKSLPLPQLMRAVYPDLYPIHALRDHTREDSDAPDPPRMHLSAERISSNGAYLLDDGETIIIYVCHNAPVSFLSDTFGVAAFSQLPDEARVLPLLRSEGNDLLQAFIDKLNDDRPYISNLLILRDNSPTRTVFTERLVEDRVESAFAYYELLQHIKAQLK